MFLVHIKLGTFKFSPYLILIDFLVLTKKITSNFSPCFFFFKVKSISSFHRKRKESTRKKRGIRPKPFQKVVNLKLGIPNLFLMYSPLTNSGITSNQNMSKEDKDKPKLAKLSAQVFPSR